MSNHRHSKQILTYGLSLFLWLLVAPGLVVSDSTPERELVIFNWSEYMDPELLKEFEDKHNVKIREVFYETDDTRDEIMLQTKGRGYDVILLNGNMINTYRKRGWLAPIPNDKVPNKKFIEQRWLKAFDSADEYGMPYFWGTLGIAYRKDLVSRPITSWQQLFEPDASLQGKILMVKASRDLIGMALKALGYSVNSTNKQELKEAETLLLKQKPYVRKYSYVGMDENSELVNGSIVAAMVYGGDALNIQEHNDQVEYVLPKEGGNIWVDYLVVSSESSNKDLAYKFINFIHKPKNAAKLAELLFLGTPNSEAKKYLSREHIEDPIIYPGQKLLQNSEFYKILPGRNMRVRSGIYSRIVD